MGTVDRTGRSWDIELSIPRVEADGVYITASIKLGENGDKVDVKDLDLTVELQDVHIEMECLFPRNGKCCPKKYLKSCNSVLSKTVHRFINRDGKNFVDRFQPEIAKQIRKILLGYFKKAIANAESRYFIDV